MVKRFARELHAAIQTHLPGAKLSFDIRPDPTILLSTGRPGRDPVKKGVIKSSQLVLTLKHGEPIGLELKEALDRKFKAWNSRNPRKNGRSQYLLFPNQRSYPTWVDLSKPENTAKPLFYRPDTFGHTIIIRGRPARIDKLRKALSAQPKRA